MNKKQRTIYNRFKKEVEEEKRKKEDLPELRLNSGNVHSVQEQRSEDHICWACGKTVVVNPCGMCEDCWLLYGPHRWKEDEKE